MSRFQVNFFPELPSMTAAGIMFFYILPVAENLCTIGIKLFKKPPILKVRLASLHCFKQKRGLQWIFGDLLNLHLF